MKCNWEWLSAYLDGALSDDKRAKLEEHLKTCEACAAKLEEFARVEQTAKRIPVPQLSEAYWENFANRVQNKLTIREKQRTTPAWLEALKNFFQPTTGKLAIAGSLATILLVAIMGRDYWKKEAYQPPRFEAVAPSVNDKIDSVQEPAKDESAFRMARPDEKNVATDNKRVNKIASAKVANEGIIDSRKNAPAALAPAEIVSKPAGRQKSKEEPSSAGYVERDEAVKGDTVIVTAGKKAENRKEVTTSQVKISAEGIEKLPIRNAEDLLKAQVGVTKKDSNFASTRESSRIFQVDTLIVTPAVQAEIRKLVATQQIRDAEQTMPAIDTTQVVADIRQVIAEKEKKLKGNLSKRESESLYVYLAQYYVQLYRFSLEQGDWDKADKRLSAFLKAELSDSARQRLVAIQNELQKLKK